MTLAALTLSDIAVLPEAAWLALAALLGLVFGSFITALSYRVPRGESIAAGRSQCPACNAALTARDLVPVLSWAMTGGRCRACGAGISWRYPATEILTAVVFASAVWREPRLLPLILLLAAAVLMITLAVIDLEHRRLPLSLLGVLAAVAALYGWLSQGDDALRGLITASGAVLIGLGIAAASRHVLGTPLMGAGDAYSLAIGALMLPWMGFLIFLGLAGGLALAFGFTWRLAKHDALFPFGPAVFAALWLALLVHENLAALIQFGFVS
ncbi:MAG: prepilin peptidase [Rhodospirillaceae bacterium]|nr:prepilin peptidase [Rhodospirillaceae bacterium]